MKDRRASPRVRVKQFIVGLPDGERYLRGNISSGGVGLEIDEVVQVEVGDTVTIRLPIPDGLEALELSAVVRHAQFRASDGVLYLGASFVGVDELVQNPLDRYVEEAHVRAQSRAQSSSSAAADEVCS